LGWRGRLVAAEAVLLDWKCVCGNPVVMEFVDDGGYRQGLCIDCSRAKLEEICRQAFYSAITGRECSHLKEQPHDIPCQGGSDGPFRG